MTGAADAADAAGWEAHRRGRADLRDTHWHYRDVLRRLTDESPARGATSHHHTSTPFGGQPHG